MLYGVFVHKIDVRGHGPIIRLKIRDLMKEPWDEEPRGRKLWKLCSLQTVAKQGLSVPFFSLNFSGFSVRCLNPSLLLILILFLFSYLRPPDTASGRIEPSSKTPLNLLSINPSIQS